MKGLYRRGDVYWIRFTPFPRQPQCFASTGETDEAKAIVAARAIMTREAEVAASQAGTCAAEIEAYVFAMQRRGLAESTRQSRRYVLTAACDEIGVTSPRTLSKAAILKWYDSQRVRNERTAIAYLTIIRYWCEWLCEAGKLSVNPAKGIIAPKLRQKVRRAFLLPDQARKLIAECSDLHLRFALYCALHAGMRKLEIVEARCDWFDLDAGLLHVQATDTFEVKDRDDRTVPLTDDFIAWLKTEFWPNGKPPAQSYALKPEVKKGRYRYRYDFRTAFENMMRDQQLPNTFHDLRRTFASLLVSKGISIYKVAKWLGDEVAMVEKTYGHLIPNDAEINAIWR